MKRGVVALLEDLFQFLDGDGSRRVNVVHKTNDVAMDDRL